MTVRRLQESEALGARKLFFDTRGVYASYRRGETGCPLNATHPVRKTVHIDPHFTAVELDLACHLAPCTDATLSLIATRL